MRNALLCLALGLLPLAAGWQGDLLNPKWEVLETLFRAYSPRKMEFSRPQFPK
jgi:hypothetical protein